MDGAENLLLVSPYSDDNSPDSNIDDELWDYGLDGTEEHTDESVVHGNGTPEYKVDGNSGDGEDDGDDDFSFSGLVAATSSSHILHLLLSVAWNQKRRTSFFFIKNWSDHCSG